MVARKAFTKPGSLKRRPLSGTLTKPPEPPNDPLKRAYELDREPVPSKQERKRPKPQGTFKRYVGGNLMELEIPKVVVAVLGPVQLVYYRRVSVTKNHSEIRDYMVGTVRIAGGFREGDGWRLYTSADESEVQIYGRLFADEKEMHTFLAKLLQVK